MEQNDYEALTEAEDPAPPAVQNKLEEAPNRLCDSTINSHISAQWTCAFIRLALAFTHVVFFLGQTKVMWFLYSEVELDFKVHAKDWIGRALFQAVKLPNPVPVNFTMHQVLEEFTYWDAIRGLWLGRTGPPNPLYDQTPGFWGKFSAFLLILFSAVWPHFKLLWLNLEYHRKVTGNFDLRTNTLYWLDTFGKWSLADVFVICTLLAVLNVDIPISGEAFLSGLEYQFEQIKLQLKDTTSVVQASNAVCTELLNLWDCDSSTGQCQLCMQTMELAFQTVPTMLTAIESLMRHCYIEGKLLATIRVKGLSGIYYFCVATLCSLLLSWAVDVIDHRMRKIRAHRLNIPSQLEVAVDEPPPVATGWELVGTLPQRAKALEIKWTLLLALSTFAFVLLAAFVPIVERRVPGSVMDLVEADFQVHLQKQYRLYDLVTLTGEAGGWDYLLMTTLLVFLLVGPLLRAFVLLVLIWLPMPNRVQRRLAFASSSLGVLAGWDVLIVAFCMVTLEMPRITQGIISPKLTICKFLHQLGLREYCISIEFLLLPEFALLPIAVCWLLICAARVTRMTYFVFDPYGDKYSGAPDCVSACAAAGVAVK